MPKMTLTELKEASTTLTIQEKQELASFLVEYEPEVYLSASVVAEARKRADSVLKGTAKTVDGDKVLQKAIALATEEV